MLNLRSARTQQVVGDLLTGRPVTLGGKTIEPFAAQDARLLRLLARHLPTLADEKGAELARRVVDLFAEEATDEGGAPAPSVPSPGRRHWKLLALRACSFRGLAPADCEWEYDFAGRSHLLHGPNGTGKSSLLGGVA